ncbi:Rqc2 family fibronectin-binding protein [Oceanivirga miroungae]|uniref:Fibronectin-binding protein-like protein A n=1 Tax=Oceanivirga miroungae TaxID=1130046 RepID=A0A6I8M9W9_9FUSO|nr:NFACT family protein [Oceanivirga miroungae]VWL85107.1 Fibronectin-binding protein-like protein A [Oceanivirga miroungae]
MIYLDTVGFSFLVSEIRSRIKDLKIRKIQSYDSNSFSILFNKENLYFENKKEAIIYLKDKKVENTNKELNFILKLKKDILSSIVKDVSILSNDRIVNVKLEKLDLLNNIKEYNLIYEFLGKSVNVILTDEKYEILATMYPNISNRVLLKGAKYEVPENNNESRLVKNLSLEKKEKFLSSYEAIIYDNNLLTYNDFYENKKKTVYNSLNEALNFYFENTSEISQMETKKRPILKNIRQNIKRLNKILEKIPKDIEENKNYEENKKLADILLANLYKVKEGMEKVQVFDYYENKEINISLDKNLSPSKNVEKLYNKYSKLKRKKIALEKREVEVKNELYYYLEQELFVLNEKELVGLEEIEKELGIKNTKISSNKKEKRKIYHENYQGFDIYMGRNSTENEEVTFKIGKNNDMWLHAKDVPGSHVIIKGNNIPSDVLEYAAKLALNNSKSDKRGDVDYTLKKNVSKIKGGKKAMVTYVNHNTINIK